MLYNVQLDKLNQNRETLLYEKLTLQQKILEEILLDVLLKKEEISKRNNIWKH